MSERAENPTDDLSVVTAKAVRELLAKAAHDMAIQHDQFERLVAKTGKEMTANEAAALRVGREQRQNLLAHFHRLNAALEGDHG